jgi:hypothetical protein
MGMQSRMRSRQISDWDGPRHGRRLNFIVGVVLRRFSTSADIQVVEKPVFVMRNCVIFRSLASAALP